MTFLYDSRTTDPDQADLFFIPFYSTAHLLQRLPQYGTDDPAVDVADVERKLYELVVQQHPYFNRCASAS